MLVIDSQRGPESMLPALSFRQKEIIELLAHSLSPKQIANELGISESTVRMHINVLKKRFNVSSCYHLMAVVTALGLCSLSMAHVPSEDPGDDRRRPRPSHTQVPPSRRRVAAPPHPAAATCSFDRPFADRGERGATAPCVQHVPRASWSWRRLRVAARSNRADGDTTSIGEDDLEARRRLRGSQKLVAPGVAGGSAWGAEDGWTVRSVRRTRRAGSNRGRGSAGELPEPKGRPKPKAPRPCRERQVRKGLREAGRRRGLYELAGPATPRTFSDVVFRPAGGALLWWARASTAAGLKHMGHLPS